MWSKRREDELPQRPDKSASVPAAPVTSTTEPQKRETYTMSSPTRPFEPETNSSRGGSAALGKNVTVKGQIFVFFVMMVAAAEAAVGLAIIIAVFRARATLAVDRIDLMKL